MSATARSPRPAPRQAPQPRSGRAPRRVPAAQRQADPRPVWPAAALASARAAAYRLFAALLLYPDTERLGRLQTTAGELRRHDDALATFAFYGPWRRLLIALQELTTEDAAALQTEHVRLFSTDPSGTPCFPYESCYVAPGGQERGWLTARLQHTYAFAGLRLAPSLNENPDHAAVELEFMAYLCGQEADAWEHAARDDGLRALKRERSFLRHHLGRWFGMFARQVQRRAAVPLYAMTAEAADAFIQHDHDLVNALLGQLEQRWEDLAPSGDAGAGSPAERPR